MPVPSLLLFAGVVTGFTPAITHLPTATARRATAPILSEVVIPRSIPAFGLSEREQIRFRHMIMPDEPLPHEVFGLQVLLGAIGTQIAGFVGCLMGTFQVAPCLSWLPGKFGDGIRQMGWQSFAVMRSGARWTVTLYRASGMVNFVKALQPAFARSSALVGAICLAIVRFLYTSLIAVVGTFATTASGMGYAARRMADAAESARASVPQLGRGGEEEPSKQPEQD